MGNLHSIMEIKYNFTNLGINSYFQQTFSLNYYIQHIKKTDSARPVASQTGNIHWRHFNPLGLAMSKRHRLGDLNIRNLFLTALESGGPRLRCGWSEFSLFANNSSSCYVLKWQRVSYCCHSSSSSKATNLITKFSPLMICSNTNTSQSLPLQILSLWGLGL